MKWDFTTPGQARHQYLPLDADRLCGVGETYHLQRSVPENLCSPPLISAAMMHRQPKTPIEPVPTDSTAGRSNKAPLPSGLASTAVTGKIRIAYLIDAMVSDTAGTEKYLIEIIKRLDRNVFEPYLIVLAPSRFLELVKPPCPVFVLGYKGFLKPNFLQVVRELASLMHEHRFHLVQTFFEDSIFVGFLAARRRPRQHRPLVQQA